MPHDSHPPQAAALAVAAALVAVPATGLAQANDIGDIATQVGGQFTEIINLVGVVAMAAGAVLGTVGLFKARAMNQNPQDPSNKLSTVIVTFGVAAALLVLPEVLGVGVTSLFGGGQGPEILTGGDLLN